MLVGDAGARPLPVGTGVSRKSRHSPRGVFKLFAEVYGNAHLAFLSLPRARVMGWFGQASNQQGSSKGGSGGRGQAPLLGPESRLLFLKCPHYRYEIHPRCCEKPPVNRINCTMVLNPKHLLGLTSATRHTPAFIVEVIRLQLAGLFVELAAVQSK